MKYALLLLLINTAHADDKVAHAKQLYADGKRYYDVADYGKAIDAWKQAYVLASAPMLLFNIGQAYRLNGDCTTALKFYASYEREAAVLSNKDELDEARSRCDPHPTNANPPEPPPKPVEPPVVVAEPPKPEPPKPAAPIDLDAHPMPRTRVVDDGATERYLGIGVGAAGVALSITGIVLATRASATAHDVEQYRGEWGPPQQDLQAHGHALATWSWITGLVGIAGVATGATLFVLGHHTSTITLEPTGVAWSGSF